MPDYQPYLSNGVTHCCIIMVDDADNKKELEMWRKEQLLH